MSADAKSRADDIPGHATAYCFALFDTAIGVCSIVWNERGIAGTQLPEGGAAKSRARVLRRFAHATEESPMGEVKNVIDGIISLLRGDPTDFSATPLNMESLPEFHRRVYAAASAIPHGRTRTYGEIAAAIGEPGAARAVGRALGANPFPIIVPCHRVVAAGGKMGGFSARGGVDTKLQLLAIECGAGPLFE